MLKEAKMNWGAWLGLTFGTSLFVALISFIAFFAYSRGHVEGYRDGLKDKAEINERYGVK